MGDGRRGTGLEKRPGEEATRQREGARKRKETIGEGSGDGEHSNPGMGAAGSSDTSMLRYCLRLPPPKEYKWMLGESTGGVVHCTQCYCSSYNA
jgi:hypothetical protein